MNFKRLVLLCALASCGGKPAQPESPIVKETGPAVPETCCCKNTPIGAVDGKPIWEANVNRMECSTKHGDCVPDVQCQSTPNPAP